MTAGAFELKNDPLFKDIKSELAEAKHAADSPAEKQRLGNFKTTKVKAGENAQGAELTHPTLLNRMENEGRGHQVVYEKPWHRMALHLFTANMSIREVAAVLDKSDSAVSDLLRTGWFQKQLTETIEKNGGSDVMALCKSEAINSIQTLIEIRDNPSVPAMARRACAMDLLERYHGKAVQKIETKHSYASDDPVQEAANLEKQISGLVPQLAPPSFVHEKN